MHEVEIKILDIDRGEVETRLVSLGARKTFEGRMQAIYYDNESNLIRRQRGVLRLRKEGDRAVLAFKSHVESEAAKVREEREVGVSSFEEMNAILRASGFRPWLRMEKDRTTYELEGVHFEIDNYHGEHEFIPEFLEIEGPDVDTVYRYAALLGFKEESCLAWDAVQLAEHYASRER